jgi:hypothetical protein
MANDKKKSKGPQHRNSNYQMKNGNAVSKKHEKKQVKKLDADRPVDTKSAPKAKPEGQKSLISNISGSISSATNSITRIFKSGP